jgi:filamentous hemagglutinin family protein
VSKASSFFQLSLCTIGCFYVTSNTTLAQVTSDGTVNTLLTENGNVSEITGGQTRGNNLFHSFRDFSVGTGNEAFFKNADNISNIFSRVTGGSVSNIDGLIRANGSASLFLINPAGIIFGENARLDIGGSFYGSSASSILFKDGEFSATDLENPPVLTINAPIGLNFRDEPGNITVRGDGQGTRITTELIDTENALRVNGNKTFALVGGKLNLEGATIKTAGGRIELGSVGGNEQVSFTPVNEGFSLDYAEVENFQDIQLSQTSNVDASGVVAGDIKVQGQNISLLDGRIEANTIGKSPSQDTPGTVEINAIDTIDILGAIRSSVYPDAVGNSAAINITTSNLTLASGSFIDNNTFGAGDGGEININATESVTVDPDTDIFTFIGSQVFAEGNGGAINITTPNLTLNDGGSILANTTGAGDSGEININATESVAVDGEGSGIASNEFILIDFFFSYDEFKGTIGDAGAINITTPNLTLNDGGSVFAQSFSGNGGEININTSNLTLSDSVIDSSNFEEGGVGNITLQIADDLTLRNNSTISARGGSNADAGNVNINTNFIVAFPEGNNDILANAEQGQGGNININAQAILGIAERPLNGLTNDINASSQVTGLDGTVNLNTPDINPIQGATELPANVVEQEQTTAQACQADRETTANSGLTIKDKGGVPPAPDLPLNSQNISINGEIDPTISTIPEPIETSLGKIQPARGIKVTKDGRVTLTAYRTNNAGERIPEIKPNCR